MKNARVKDIFRTIGHEKKRFVSIMVITALGVAMLTGLRAACDDLRRSADVLYDSQSLFDIQISSTLGLDDEDVEALLALDDVEAAEGEFSENVYTEVEGVHCEAMVRTLGDRINVPTVIEGTLPQADDEIAVTETYLIDTGKRVGDTLEFSEEDTGEGADSYLLNTEYVITALVMDPFDINNRQGAVSFRASASADYTFFVTPQAADTDIYTSIYVTVRGASELMCYDDDYKDLISQVKNEINSTLKTERQQARYDSVYGEAMDVYNDAYDDAMSQIDDAQSEIDDAGAELDDAQTEIDDGWAEYQDGLDQLEAGKSELASQEKSANAQIAAARAQIDEGYDELNEAKTQLDEAAETIAAGEEQLAAAQSQLDAAREESLAQIDDALEELQDGTDQMRDALAYIETLKYAAGQQLSVLEKQLAALEGQLAGLEEESGEQSEVPEEESGEQTEDPAEKTEVQATELESQREALEEQIAALKKQIADLEEQLTELESQTEELEAQLSEAEAGTAYLEEQRTEAVAQFDAAQAEIDTQSAALAEGRQQYEAGLAQWQAGRAELDAAQSELNSQAASGQAEIAAAWATIDESEQALEEGRQALEDGQAELDDGLAELEDAQSELNDAREDALSELADAKAEIDDIDMAKWYIQSRDYLSGYSNVDSDATSIEGIATFLPLIFLVVAILISLTAVTRMVEEERGLIGTYKALGFTDREIRAKYLLFGAGASLAGGIAGDFCGFVILPKIIFTFFAVMYTLPDYLLYLMPGWAVIGVVIFAAGVLLTVFYAVEGNLRQVPAELMRPEVPKAGTRILLERFTGLWRRMSFLNKVTARNLFRYKKRMAMTVIGIMGCTGLLVCSFAIKNTVTDLMPKQYENVNRYDILAVVLSSDNDRLVSYMDDPENIETYVNLEVDSVSIRNASEESMSVQMLVFPDDAQVSDFVKIADTKGNETELSDDGIMVTRSIGDVLGFSTGDTAVIQDLSLNESEVPVALVTENYLGDMIYVSESCYEKYFAGDFEQNAVLVNLTESCKENDPVAYSKELGAKDGLLSTVSTETLKDEFSQAFTLINLVVYVILVMAAALAFVVLFTLSSTNISERCRELATIKVLGFYDREVHVYVNKETLILAAIGTALGLPAGRAFISLITVALKIPGVYFDISVHVSTYVICAAVSIVFALIVNLITNGILNRIDPAEALKSIE